jgi:endoglycosylceramidase
VGAALVALVAVAVASAAPVGAVGAADGATGAARRRPALRPLHVAHDGRPRIVDDRGREVTLRGVNVNSLGDYYAADPTLPPVLPVTGADWNRMAAHGFSVVRLLVSWSRLEPRPGLIDRGYVEQIRRAVDAAARRGMYTVIDMHQDAWGKHIATPAGHPCPPGREPAIGWDGAPAWATITDGAETCRGESREDSAAVQAAWDAFYADRDGIQSHLVGVWGALAERFARHPAVAGFDLINEPNHGTRSDTVDRLADFYRRAIAAIRAGERRGAGRAHPIVFETTVVGAAVPADFSTDPNLVFEGHNYGESIGDFPIEGVFAYFQGLADAYDAPLWIGEYGWFSDPAANRSKLERYSRTEDALLVAGSAWWQWRQACGDPHSIGRPGGTPDPVLVHFQRNGCPGDVNLGVVPEWSCTWRPYPRTVPGALTVRSATCEDVLGFAGATDRPGVAEIWFPGAHAPRVAGRNVGVLRTRRVPGGWSIRALVAGDYVVFVAR